MTAGGAVTFAAADGTPVHGDVVRPEGAVRAGAVLVHASKHERDAYGVSLPQLLVDDGFAVLRIDVRGRGESREPVPFPLMAPLQRRAVALDVAAAVDFLAGPDAGIAAGSVAVVSEQDSSGPALAARPGHPVAAHVVISGRLDAGAREGLDGLAVPVLALVSTEDRRAVGDVTELYLASGDERSRLRVVRGMGFGTTMFSAWQFAHPSEPTMEESIAAWLTGVL